MKTDQELLELAAKAAGIDMQHRAMFGGDAEPGYYKYPPGVPPLWTWWDPLTADGDALRLAVKLDMDINIESAFGHTRANECFEDHGDDPCAATRRAIVRAAAEIGAEGHEITHSSHTKTVF